MGKLSEIIVREFTPLKAVLFLTFALGLQYVDRSIIAGAGTSIMSRENGFNINTAQLGLLQSSFMVGYIFGALIFAHLATSSLAETNSEIKVRSTITSDQYINISDSNSHSNSQTISRRKSISPFSIISFSFLIWIISALISGSSKTASKNSVNDNWKNNSDMFGFCLLILGRALSGVGEAALSALSLPFLDRILNPKSKGFYVSIYYAAIPFGSAIGYIWAGVVTSLFSGQWQYAFLLEAPMMIPFLAISLYTPPFLYFKKFDEKQNHENHLKNNYQLPSENLSLLSQMKTTEMETIDVHAGISAQEMPVVDSSHAIRDQTNKISFKENILSCLRRPIYLLTVLGYAIYTGVISGLGFYVPIFIQKYRPEDPRWRLSQKESDVIFGLVIASSGLIGTLLGGFIMDRATHTNVKDYVLIVKILITEVAIATSVTMLMLVMTNPILFFIGIFLSVLILFTVSTGINLLLIWSVPEENRPMASALTVAIIHILGDVPSPIIIGAVNDVHTPLFTFAVTSFTIIIALFIWATILLLPKQKLFV